MLGFFFRWISNAAALCACAIAVVACTAQETDCHRFLTQDCQNHDILTKNQDSHEAMQNLLKTYSDQQGMYYELNDVLALFDAEKQRQDIPFNMVEYGCIDRSELMIADLLKEGVHPWTLGRISNLETDLSKPTLDRRKKELETTGQTDVMHVSDHVETQFQDDLKSSTFLTPVLYQRGVSIGVGHTKFTFSPDNPTHIVAESADSKHKYTIHRTPDAYWTVGHIAPTIRVHDPADDKVKTLVFDPALGDKPMSIEAWKAKQNNQNSAVIWGALGQKPALLENFMTPQQKQRWDGLQGTQEERTADFFHLEKDSALHPSHWGGRSLEGDPKGADGKPLPDWNEATPLERLARENLAKASLQPIVDYRDALTRGLFLSNSLLRMVEGTHSIPPVNDNQHLQKQEASLPWLQQVGMESSTAIGR